MCLNVCLNMCLNAKSLVTKKSELNLMVGYIDTHIIRIIETSANKDIEYAELGLTGS